MSLNINHRITISELAEKIAKENSDIQSDFFNKLALHLTVACNDKDLSGSQVNYIVLNLDKKGELLIDSLSEFLKLKRERQ